MAYPFKDTMKVAPEVLVLDVDGVLTDGKFYYTAEGKVMKVFGADDHDALCLLKPYLHIQFVTGDHRGFDISKARIVTDMKMALDLVSTIQRYEWIKERWDPARTIYMGDGIFDHYVFEKVAYGIAPANADESLRARAHFVTKRNGGERAVAEAALHILERFFEPFDRAKPVPTKAPLSGTWSA